jgi:hypothetical protein
LAQVVVMVREFLAKVNTETGKTENRFNLLQLDQQLIFKPGEEVVRVLFCICDRILRRISSWDFSIDFHSSVTWEILEFATPRRRPRDGVQG